jgi:hypothetical protein
MRQCVDTVVCGTELETVTFYPKWNIYLAIIGTTRSHVC